MNKDGHFLIKKRESEGISAQVGLKNYALLLLGLALCYVLIFFYQIEESFQLPYLFLLVIPSFAIHAKLPLSYRQPFLFLVNLIAILLLFGVWPGLGIIAFGLLLYVIISLPIQILYRGLLCLIVGSVLVLGKLGYIPLPKINTIATIVGGLFMFRAVVFLYEKQYEKQSAGFWSEINYFFLLPNLIFTIFPIVDYKTYVRSYYDVPASDNYFKGLLWIMRGLFHLMLYRITYYYLIPAPGDVVSFWGLIQYMVLSYALVIRLSGIFHLSTGILALFGLNLPPTFDNYFLASGFSDLWRRINVYWRDFMMKIFYFPIFFKFKKRNDVAIFITVIIVFIINWLLHQYQWLWIRGNMPLRWIDFIFWILLGVLVAFNSIYQKRNKKKKQSGFSAKAAFAQSFKVIGMFAFMSVLWSFWTSPSVEIWMDLISNGSYPAMYEVVQLVIGVLGLAVLGVGLQYVHYWWRKNKSLPSDMTLLKIFSVGSLIFAFLGTPKVSQEVGQVLSFDVTPILETKLNKADEEQLFKGYYETLLVGNNFSSRMWEVQEEEKLEKEKLTISDMMIKGPGLIGKRLSPNMQIEHKNAIFTTNAHGLRDRLYTLKKQAGVLRIALLGGSGEMGVGVNDEETFENLVEDLINEQKIWPEFSKVEILNFSLPRIHLAEQVGIVEQRILSFDPDVVMYFVHNIEREKNLQGFAATLKKPIIKEYPFLKKIATEVGITPNTSSQKGMRLLKPYEVELEDWGLNRIMAVCTANSIVPVCVNLKVFTFEGNSESLDIYRQKGFHVLDLYDIFEDMNEEELQVSKWDRHPNVKAHEIVAQNLLEALKNDEELNRAILRKK